jgi:hypothetical protein
MTSGLSTPFARILVLRALVTPLALAAPCAALLAAPAAMAQETPSHAFQAVEAVRLELDSFLAAAGTAIPKYDNEVSSKRPRHVIQKARENLVRVQTLRNLNGLAEKPVPDLPTTEVTPGDVKKVVDRLYEDVKELRPRFNAKGMAAPPPFVDGKKPTDVYRNLWEVSMRLDALGVPKPVPNDVYRLALLIKGDMDLVRQKLNITTPFKDVTGNSGKKPADAFDAALAAMATLKGKVDQNPKYAIPDSVVPPIKPTSVTPANVIDALNVLAADVGSLKVKLGISAATPLPPAPQGKTPSNVVDLVSTIDAMIATL